MEQNWDALIGAELSASLQENKALFKRILRPGVNSDAVFRPLEADGRPALLIYIEGMADDKKIAEFILRASTGKSCAQEPVDDAQQLIRRVLEIAQCKSENRVRQIVEAVVGGMTALFAEGFDEAVLMETRGYPARSVNQTTNESVVIGAQEGFVESLRTNMTLLRRYVQSPRLITECFSVGCSVPCRLCLAYLDGVADVRIVEEARRRLKSIDAPAVQGLGAVQQLIEDSPWSLLPQMLQTERPDRAASCLLEGQVVILAENSPLPWRRPSRCSTRCTPPTTPSPAGSTAPSCV